jgi:hypothetical protein
VSALQVVTRVSFELQEEEPKNNQVTLFLQKCKGIPKTILNRVIVFQWAGSAYWTRRKLGAKPKEKEVKLMLFQEFLLVLRKDKAGWKFMCSFAVGGCTVSVDDLELTVTSTINPSSSITVIGSTQVNNGKRISKSNNPFFFCEGADGGGCCQVGSSCSAAASGRSPEFGAGRRDSGSDENSQQSAFQLAVLLVAFAVQQTNAARQILSKKRAQRNSCSDSHVISSQIAKRVVLLLVAVFLSRFFFVCFVSSPGAFKGSSPRGVKSRPSASQISDTKMSDRDCILLVEVPPDYSALAMSFPIGTPYSVVLEQGLFVLRMIRKISLSFFLRLIFAAMTVRNLSQR